MHMPDGRTMLEHVMARAAQISDDVLVAFPTDDTAIFDLCREQDWRYRGGSEPDVLGRYLAASDGYEHVVRVTGDCPLLDVEAARLTVRQHLDSGADVTHHLAEGRGVQVFKREALLLSDQCSSVFYREHPGEWLFDHVEEAGLTVELMKFSVDTEDDLHRVRAWMSETT